MTLGLRQSWAPFHGLLHHPVLAIAGFDHVMTPGAHRRHHALDGGLVNLGPVFTWWDRATGTWVPPEDDAPVIVEASGARSTSAIGIEIAGWRELLSRRVA